MPEVILTCPQCQRQLRVPENLLGRPVKCPACGMTFTVPAAGAEPQPVAAQPAEVRPSVPEEGAGFEEPYDGRQAGGAAWEEAEPASRRAQGQVMAPAVILLVIAVIGLLANLAAAAVFAATPERLEEAFKGTGLQPPPATTAVIFYLVFAALNLVILLACVQMLRLRTYGFALAGIFLSMINCPTYCCVIGLPIGIWALVVLLRPEVRDAFR